jgi:hypothetical protein
LPHEAPSTVQTTSSFGQPLPLPPPELEELVEAPPAPPLPPDEDELEAPPAPPLPPSPHSHVAKVPSWLQVCSPGEPLSQVQGCLLPASQ